VNDTEHKDRNRVFSKTSLQDIPTFSLLMITPPRCESTTFHNNVFGIEATWARQSGLGTSQPAPFVGILAVTSNTSRPVIQPARTSRGRQGAVGQGVFSYS